VTFKQDTLVESFSHYYSKEIKQLKYILVSFLSKYIRI